MEYQIYVNITDQLTSYNFITVYFFGYVLFFELSVLQVTFK